MMILEVKSSEEYILVPESVLDISSGKLSAGKAIVINNGLINGLVEKDDLVVFTRDSKRKVIALEGLIFMPGLIDCHIHLALDGIDTPKAIARWEDPEVMLDHLSNALNSTLEHGIVAVRDGGDNAAISLRLKQRVADVPIPFVRASGFALRKEGYYGSFLGKGSRDVTGITKQVEELKELGANQIKVLVSGIVSFKEFGKVGQNQFTLEELQEIVEVSHGYGLKVMAHASSDQAVRLAIDAGADSVEHGYFLSDFALKLMAERGISWIPTVVPVYIQTTSPWRDSYTSEEIEVITKTYELQLAQLAKAASLGVTLGIGTDAGATGVLHGESYFTELQLFKKAGLDNLTILQAATLNGAKIIGLEGSLGAVSPGYKPCLIALSQNPLENLEALQKIEVICLTQ